MKTTLNKIREHSPCTEGWEKLLTYLGKTKADDEPLSLLTILDSNGLNDALWCLRAVEGKDREIRLYAVWCARQVQHLLKDQRSIDALDVAERYAKGEATAAELAAAGDDARDAARAARAARAVECDVAGTSAACAAAWDAEAAAWSAAPAAGVAANAAKAAAWAVTRSAAGAYATEAAARAKQEAELRRICGEG